MNKQQARQIIKDTFERAFDKGRFTGFVKNLLNHVEDALLTYQGNYIPEKFRRYIKTMERIGKFSDGENNFDILIITLQKDTSLERARTMQRNFIAWYLNGSRPGGGLKDAALVAYVSPDQADWRFSLVKMDYKFDEKGKVKEEFTPARRWSFLVGANEKSHTAQSRLEKILVDDEHDPTLAELEEAFNIETVTKEFFIEYRELFLRTKEALDSVVRNSPQVKADFEAKGVDTVNFAKKLLGQIVFLYFLQKKGWFGVGRDDTWGTGSKHFLRSLFEKHKGNTGILACENTADSNVNAAKNFFNDILEPLFYEALRIDRSHDDHYYSRFNCKIPFLNGGLFDPIGSYDWVHTDINLPDDLFSSSRKTREGDEGDGILDVFDRYNFTVREDEPLEKEVAIDPELLGKAYEKFNAIRPDNFAEFTDALKSGNKGEENKFNKKFGVYYTPREIVHYMCKQSLSNYLHSKVTQAPQAEDCTKATQASLPDAITRQDIEDLIEVGEMIAEHEATALIKQDKIRNGIQKSTEYTALLPDSIRNNAAAIDKLLADITVCDPAVGSGAFPVGMMTEIVRTRNVLSVFFKSDTDILVCGPVCGKNSTTTGMSVPRSSYEFKRRCIEHSLYGVDIDPGAVEIAKLRLWLSLVVDEEDIKNIKPLPNLDYKIMQGNSLISEFMGINFDDKNEQAAERLSALAMEEKVTDKTIEEKARLQVCFYNQHHKEDTALSKALKELNLNKIRVINDIKKIKKETEKNNHAAVQISELLKAFQRKKDEFLNESNVSRKTRIKDEVEQLLIEIFESRLRTQKSDFFSRLKGIEEKYSVVPNSRQRGELIEQEKNKLYRESGFDLEQAEKQLKEFSSGKKIKPFFLWKLYFSEVFNDNGGFDVVIANPPYLRIQEIQKNDAQLAKSLKAKFASAIGSFDIYACFVEQAEKLINGKGNITFILPHKFFQSAFGKNLRQLISSKKMLRKIVDFGSSQVFETATTYTCLLFLSYQNEDFEFAELKADTTAKDIMSVFHFIDAGKQGENDKVALKFLSNAEIGEEEWHFTAGDSGRILAKLRQQPRRLSDVCEKMFQGIATSADKIYFLQHISENNGVVTVYSKSLDKEIQIEKGFVKPLLKGADVHRYAKINPKIWCIFPYKFQNKKASLYSSEEIKNKFPMAWDYLLQNKHALENRENGRFKDEWWCFSRPQNLTEFEKSKIVTPDIASGCQMSLDENGLYHTTTIYSFIFKRNLESIKYFLALLNSSVVWYFLTSTGSVLRGGFFRFKTNYLMPFPIPPQLSSERQQPFIDLADKIIALTKDADYLQNPAKQAQVKEYERQIDQMVYDLYGLTDEEIKIVEGETK